MPEPVPAFERYDGYFYRIIKNSLHGTLAEAPFDLCILSAEHGLLNPSTAIEYYNREMDEERADELKARVVPDLKARIESAGYDRVVVNVGQAYWNAIEGFDDELDVQLTVIEGNGLGEKGHGLKEFLQTEILEPVQSQAL